MTPYLDDGDVVLHLGDCLEVLATFPADSVDVCITDPPYGIRFMGQAWDGADISGDARFAQKPGDRAVDSTHAGPAMVAGTYDLSARANREFGKWCEAWGREVLRVLKPGAHLLSFGGTRTYHRLTCGLEDAGFEIRDALVWLYGSGFPKSRNVARDLDDLAGVQGTYGAPKSDAHAAHLERGSDHGESRHEGWGFDPSRDALEARCRVYLPASPLGKKFNGWGTGLKPFHEPIVLARKPLAERSIARQVAATGTGALNIDGARIPFASDADRENTEARNRHGSWGTGQRQNTIYGEDKREVAEGGDYSGEKGRWPPNVVLDESAAAILDAEAGERGGGYGVNTGKPANVYGDYAGLGGEVIGYGDSGGPSRFCYTAKASTAERDGATHPTIKPQDVMRWCIRLLAPPGGVVLDPFAGSGSTLKAARDEGFRSIGIEREPEYARQIAHRLRQLSLGI